MVSKLALKFVLAINLILLTVSSSAQQICMQKPEGISCPVTQTQSETTQDSDSGSPWWLWVVLATLFICCPALFCCCITKCTRDIEAAAAAREEGSFASPIGTPFSIASPRSPLPFGIFAFTKTPAETQSPSVASTASFATTVPNECPICLNKFAHGEPLACLSCNHVFHKCAFFHLFPACLPLPS